MFESYSVGHLNPGSNVSIIILDEEEEEKERKKS
jgi:hypothetical protein